MADTARGYDSDLLRGNTDSLLLYLINEQGQTYGYRLIKEIGQRSGGYFQFKEGTVYPALRKLENEGLILLDGIGAFARLGCANGRPTRREGECRRHPERAYIR